MIMQLQKPFGYRFKANSHTDSLFQHRQTVEMQYLDEPNFVTIKGCTVRLTIRHLLHLKLEVLSRPHNCASDIQRSFSPMMPFTAAPLLVGRADITVVMETVIAAAWSVLVKVVLLFTGS